MQFIRHPSLQADTGDLFYSPALRLRRRFLCAGKGKGKATLSVCGLGIGRFYINGRAVSEDLFTAPVSDYEKTLWYNRYDVTPLLREGENVFCAHLGNGFYNENFDSAWGHNHAKWRAAPKLAMRLEFADGSVVESDGQFRASPDGALYYNQLRSGEYYDARREEDWLAPGFDDSAWPFAVADDRPPAGKFRLCECPPVRETEVIPCVSVRRTGEGLLYDFGVNFSGYVRMRADAPAGTQLVLEHAEEAEEDGRLRLNNLGIFYPSVPFQTDKVICSGEKFVWSPKFTYHGFRYVLLRGLADGAEAPEMEGIFVHQAVEQTGRFSCSLPLLNKIYEAGIRSSLSNMFYSLTDCPTREKLGWTNDAAASTEQLLLNFDIRDFFRKWAVDMADAMREDGNMPGIVPSCDWGYGIGPVTDAILYELPYNMYRYCADEEFVRFLYPYSLRNLHFLADRLERGEWFDLGDWTGVRNKGDNAPFVQCMLLIGFLKKTIFLAGVIGEDASELVEMLAAFEEKICREYLSDGDYLAGGQTAPAMLLCNGMGDAEKLRARLLSAIGESGYHLDSGMIGTQYIYDALSLLGEQDLVIRMLARPTPPSFAYWFDNGATTLYETFVNEHTDSKNHHMFSNILAWFTKYVLGIRVRAPYEAEISPQYLADVGHAEGETRLFGKTLRVCVDREDGALRVHADIPEGIAVYAERKRLPAGEQVFRISVKQ